MKTKTIFRKAAFTILSVMLFTACSKTGPQGPAGPKGDKGDTGAKGATGTANVMYSDWINFTSKQNSITGYYEADIATPKITRAVLDKEVILVYVADQAANEINQLDAAGGDPADPNSYFWITHDVWVGKITLVGNWWLKNNQKLRYIIIPGGVHLRTSNPLPDPKDYHAVCKYYGIPE